MRLGIFSVLALAASLAASASGQSRRMDIALWLQGPGCATSLERSVLSIVRGARKQAGVARIESSTRCHVASVRISLRKDADPSKVSDALFPVFERLDEATDYTLHWRKSIRTTDRPAMAAVVFNTNPKVPHWELPGYRLAERLAALEGARWVRRVGLYDAARLVWDVDKLVAKGLVPADVATAIDDLKIGPSVPGFIHESFGMYLQRGGKGPAIQPDGLVRGEKAPVVGEFARVNGTRGVAFEVAGPGSKLWRRVWDTVEKCIDARRADPLDSWERTLGSRMFQLRAGSVVGIEFLVEGRAAHEAEVVRQIERRLGGIQEVDDVLILRRAGSASFEAWCSLDDAVPRVPEPILNALGRIAGLRYRVVSPKPPASGEVEVLGPSHGAVATATDSIAAALGALPYVKSATSDVVRRPRLDVTLREDLNLKPDARSELDRACRTAAQGGRWVWGDTIVYMRRAGSLESLGKWPVRLGTKIVPLSRVASLRVGSGPVSLRRLGTRCLARVWFLTKGDARALHARLEQALAEVEVPDGVTVSLR